MKDIPTKVIGEIILELVAVFKGQQGYILSENAFEEMLSWEQLNEEWDHWNIQLEAALQREAMQDSERASIQLLIADQQKLCQYVQAELQVMSEQIQIMRNTKKARKNYETLSGGSIFYDKKK
jgi:hypothetical protein